MSTSLERGCNHSPAHLQDGEIYMYRRYNPYAQLGLGTTLCSPDFFLGGGDGGG